MAEHELEQLTKEEAFEKLASRSGRGLYQSATAFEMMFPFWQDATEEFCEKYDADTDEALLFEDVLVEEQKLAADVQTITNVWGFEPIISMSEVSTLLVEAIGKEPGTGMSVGTGSQADEIHDQNVETLAEHYDFEIPEE